MSSYQQPQINSNQSSTDDDDISTIPCPLDLQVFRDEASEKQSIGLQHLKEIEHHVQNCENSELKDIIFKNPRTETPDDPEWDPKLHYIRGSLSPLHKACFYGELDSVKHIVENWKVNVNQLASFCPAYGGQSMIDKATPLFVAATMGHIEVVRYLVEAGADVSAKSSSKYDIYKSSSDQPKSFRGLTPLYGVVVGSRRVILNSQLSQMQSDDRENRRGIVRTLLNAGAAPTLHDIRLLHDFPLWMSEVMGIDGSAVNYVKSIAALIDYGLDLNHRTPNDEGGNTILHFFTGWIGSSRDKGHTEEESLAIVQLLLERGADPKSKNAMGFTPIMRSAYYLRLPVLNFLLDRNEISRSEKVDALQLVGAVILVGIHSSSVYQDEAYQYWRKSLQLRQNADGTVSQKILRTGRVQEWMTSEELDRVINNPSEHKIQSFLVGMRILSGISWDAVKSFFGRFEDILRNTTSYSIIQKISMLWVTLDTIRCFDVREKGLWFVTLQTAGSLIETLLKLERDDPFMNDETIQTTLQLILTTDQFHKTNRESLEPWIINNYIRELLRLIKMLAGSPQIMNEENMELLCELTRIVGIKKGKVFQTFGLKVTLRRENGTQVETKEPPGRAMYPAGFVMILCRHCSALVEGLFAPKESLILPKKCHHSFFAFFGCSMSSMSCTIDVRESL